MTTKYDVPVALKEYVERIGGEVLNWRRAMVKEFNQTEEGKSYYKERTLIKINEKGEMELSKGAPLNHFPTEKEIDAIKKAYEKLEVPVPVPQSFEDAEKLRVKLKVPKDKWFVIRMLDRKSALMCQQRIEKDDGSKYYLPWTKFSMGGKAEWLNMEPGTALPFWKPPVRVPRQIMIHEGSKAAQFVDELINSEEGKKHPWFNYLQYFQHWGMNGGALAPHRADYDEIKKFNPSKLVYVCDRDYPGEAALQSVSRHLADRRLFGIMFDKRFNLNWDMADPIPEIFFKNDVYIGPALPMLEIPATWATLSEKVEGSKRPASKLRVIFKEDWYHSVTPECYINIHRPSRVYSGAEEFNNAVCPFADVRNIAVLLQNEDANKMDSLCYNPDSKPGPRLSTGGRAFNTHQPSSIRMEKGNLKPWFEYLEQLIPIPDDRKELMRWCATLIDRPDIKMTYAMLLCSEQQGVGKTTLGQNILGPLVGQGNLSMPSASDIVDSQFTDWKAHCRLIMVNEIFEGHSAKTYEKLKDLITDKFIKVNRKFVAPYDVENWAHIIACSNHKKALKLPDDDRRWFVPEVTEKLLSHEYWIGFNEWLVPKGLEAIKWWANDFLKKNDPVRPGMRAPSSSQKIRMIEEGWSPGQTLVADWLASHNGVRVVTTDHALIGYIRNVIWDGRQSDRLERPHTVRKIAKAKDWYISNFRAFIEDGFIKTRLISNDPFLIQKTWREIMDEQKTDKTIKLFWRGDQFPMSK